MPWWGWLIVVAATLIILWWVFVATLAVKVWHKIDTESDDFDNFFDGGPKW